MFLSFPIAELRMRGGEESRMGGENGLHEGGGEVKWRKGMYTILAVQNSTDRVNWNRRTFSFHSP